MRKRELVGAIAREVGIPPREVAKVVEGLFSRMADVLLEEGRFEITGFGIFNIKALKERRTYVPKRKEVVITPARRAIRFQEARELRERINPQLEGDDNECSSSLI